MFTALDVLLFKNHYLNIKLVILYLLSPKINYVHYFLVNNKLFYISVIYL